MTRRKTTLFDVLAGLLFLVLFLVMLAGAQMLKSGTRKDDSPKLAPQLPSDPLPSIVERSK